MELPEFRNEPLSDFKTNPEPFRRMDGHPFGGFNLSGTDSKAGGRDYLLGFTQAKTISEELGD